MSRLTKYGYPLWLTWLIATVFSGCAPVISEEIRRQVSPELSFQDLLRDPDRYRGQTVLFSGVILEAINTKDGTLITVLQRPADLSGRPKNSDATGGRFLALDPRYLDVAVYAPDREITVAGTVEGKRIRSLGEIDYAYPLIRVRELHLWRERPPAAFGFGITYHYFLGPPYYWRH